MISSFFQEALKQAAKAKLRNEVPIGCVLVKDGRILARAHNSTEKRGIFFAHAEILAMLKASRRLKTKYLSGCELYVSLEPCMMCIYAARLCRIEAIHFLVRSEKFGRRGRAYSKIRIKKASTTLSDLSTSSLQLLQTFFKQKR